MSPGADAAGPGAPTPKLMPVGAYRRAHPRLYGALIAHHGGPNQTQLAAAPDLMAGRDVLLCAPTASGKTEACIVPLAEALLPQVRDGVPRILMVSPTRALVNDLARRLSGPLDRVGVTVGRWTGDHHDGGRLHPLTILTPEALDARIARTPGALAQVGALIIDELHVIDGTVRGDQLRMLVGRLRARLAAGGRSLQVVAASATVPDPAAVADRYLTDAVVVSIGSRRRVRARLVEGRDPESVRQELLRLAGHGFVKVLAFCDTREGVEVMARHLRGQPPFGHTVLAHHGSLSRRARLSAEQRFRTAPVALCVATSTLEVGLDIGDVDLVALVGPPPDVPALLQRVGRGGRRGDSNTAVIFVSGPFESVHARTLLDAQTAGAWLADRSSFHPGVILQQAISVAGGRGRGVSPQVLLRRFPASIAQDWTLSRTAALLNSACDQDWLLRVGPGPHCVLGTRGERAWHRGEVHGNLGLRRTVDVVDSMTGQTVGQVSESAADRVSLGGRGRRVLAASENRVVTEAGQGSGLPSFGGGSAPTMARALAQALLFRVGLRPPCRVRLDGGETIFHGLGTAQGRLLARVLRGPKRKIRHAGPLALVLRGSPFGDATPAQAVERWPVPGRVQTTLDLHHAGLARALSLGAFHAALPDDEQRMAVALHSGASAVEIFLAAGLPPEVLVDELVEGQRQLWDAAAWT